MNIKSLILALGVLGLSGGVVFAHEGHDHGKMVDDQQAVADVINKKAVEVGNKICPVSGDKIPVPGERGTMGDKPVKYEYKGKIYNLCCSMCVKDFKKNPKKYSAVAEKEVKQVK